MAPPPLIMNDSTIDELNAKFVQPPATELEPDVLAELQSMLRIHDIPPEELYYKWEAYCVRMGGEYMKLNIETARALKQDIQDTLERENRGKSHHIRTADKRAAPTPRNVANSGDVFGMLDGLVPNTPRTGGMGKLNSSGKRKAGSSQTPSMARLNLEPQSSPPAFKVSHTPGEQAQSMQFTSFNDRPHAGQALEILNEHLEIAEPPIAPYGASRIKLTANSDTKKLSYKPLAMKSSEASEILDDKIDEFMTIIQECHGLEDSSFGSAASQSINEIVAVGRIASDSPEGRINTNSLVLETSRRTGAGLRVPLKMDSVPGFQFFPGQVVALKGKNASGTDFVVSEILDAPLLPSAASDPAVLQAHEQRLSGGPDAMETDSPPAPLTAFLASGPYTSDDNLDFEPLHALCSQAADSYADLLILTGPFLDIDHPLLASGDFDLPEEALKEPDMATMSTVFKYLITPIFQRLASSNPTITILLIPSVRDAISKHVSWPQEPFPRKDLGLPKAVRIVGNPMTISVNEIVIGISSQDILSELKSSEVVGGQTNEGGILARLPKYLLQQRHFFPLFPPQNRSALPKTGTLEGVPAGAMLDTSYLKLGEMLNVRPDLLIVPSALTAFAKVVESVLVVNPGYLSKRRGAGTYAKMTIHAASLTEDEMDAGQKVAHKLYERARVDIVKI